MCYEVHKSCLIVVMVGGKHKQTVGLHHKGTDIAHNKGKICGHRMPEDPVIQVFVQRHRWMNLLILRL